MKNEKKLGENLFFSAEEIIPAFLLILCAFLKTLAVAVTDAGTMLFYLSRSQDYLIQVPVAAAVLLMIVWGVLAAVKEKSPYVPACLMFVAAGVSVLFCAGSFFAESRVYGWAFLVWKFGFFVLTEVAFWMAAFRFGVFGGRSRLLYFVLSATVAGWFSGGILVLAFAEYSVRMVCFAAVATCFAACILKFLADNGSVPILNRFTFDKQKIKRQGNDSLQRKLLLLFYIVSGLIAFATGMYILQFLINMAVFNSLGDEETFSDSACLLGSAYMAAAFLSLPFLLIRRIGKRLGLLIGLYLFPVLLALLCLDAYPPLLSMLSVQTLFILSLFVKEAALQTVPWAVSLRTGYRSAVLRKSVIEPVALILSGVCFKLVTDVFEAEIKYVNATLAVILLLSVAALKRTYLTLVLNLLNAHLWRGGRLLLAGKKIRGWLKENLESEDSQNVLYALRVVEESENELFPQYLKRALHHPDKDVRLYALAKIEELNIAGLLPEVIASVHDDDPAIRKTAVCVMCFLGGKEEREKAQALIDDPAVREGALAGLLAAGREGVFTAIKCTADLSVSPNREDRLIAARVLGDAGNTAFYQPLTALLADYDPDVCRAALIAAGKLKTPSLLPAVLETFRFPDLRENASETLLQFKETAFDHIGAVLISDDYPVQFRIMLVKLAARVASPAAEQFLFDHIRIEDRRIRFNILEALFRAGYKAAGKDSNVIRLCLYDDMEKAANILTALDALEQNGQTELSPSLDLLKDALNKEVNFIKERVLLLLSLFYPSKALARFLNGYRTDADEDAVTLINKFPADELKTLCLALFENKTVQQRLAVLRPQFYPPVLTLNGYVRDILETPEGQITDWTRICAAYTAGNANSVEFVNALTVLSADPDPIVRETAVWAIGRILPREEAARLIYRNLNDSRVCVARMARFIMDGSGQMSF